MVERAEDGLPHHARIDDALTRAVEARLLQLLLVGDLAQVDRGRVEGRNPHFVHLDVGLLAHLAHRLGRGADGGEVRLPRGRGDGARRGRSGGSCTLAALGVAAGQILLLLGDAPAGERQHVVDRLDRLTLEIVDLALDRSVLGPEHLPLGRFFLEELLGARPVDRRRRIGHRDIAELLAEDESPIGPTGKEVGEHIGPEFLILLLQHRARVAQDALDPAQRGHVRPGQVDDGKAALVEFTLEEHGHEERDSDVGHGATEEEITRVTAQGLQLGNLGSVQSRQELVPFRALGEFGHVEGRNRFLDPLGRLQRRRQLPGASEHRSPEASDRRDIVQCAHDAFRSRHLERAAGTGGSLGDEAVQGAGQRLGGGEFGGLPEHLATEGDEGKLRSLHDARKAADGVDDIHDAAKFADGDRRSLAAAVLAAERRLGARATRGIGTADRGSLDCGEGLEALVGIGIGHVVFLGEIKSGLRPAGVGQSFLGKGGSLATPNELIGPVVFAAKPVRFTANLRRGDVAMICNRAAPLFNGELVGRTHPPANLPPSRRSDRRRSSGQTRPPPGASRTWPGKSPAPRPRRD